MTTIKNRLRILVAEKEVREGRKYSYRDIATETGLAINTVASYMRGNVENFYGDVLIAFCKWLDCQPGDIIVVVSDEQPEKTSLPHRNTTEFSAVPTMG